MSNEIIVYAVHESEEVRVHMDSGNFLRDFTRITGGISFPAGEVRAAVEQALRDSQASYLISYRPMTIDSKGKFHKIQLRSHRPGIRVRTVEGYYPARQTVLI